MQISFTLVNAAVAERPVMIWCAVKIVYNVFTAIPHLDLDLPLTTPRVTKTDFSCNNTITYFRMRTIQPPGCSGVTLIFRGT